MSGKNLTQYQVTKGKNTNMQLTKLIYLLGRDGYFVHVVFILGNLMDTTKEKSNFCATFPHKTSSGTAMSS